jgi:DNA-binding transcriptional MocR family regulator
VRIGSFSKTLSASFRCGYIAARPDWIDKLTDLRIATGFASSPLSQDLVVNVLGSSTYRKYLETLRVRLAKARADTIRRLRALGIEPWLEPNAGMFVWCRLPARRRGSWRPERGCRARARQRLQPLANGHGLYAFQRGPVHE